MIKLSYIKSGDRGYNVRRTLSLIKSDVAEKVKKANRIVIVPECFKENDPSSSVGTAALDELLAFILPYAKKQITLASGAEFGKTINAFKNFGYLSLQGKYDLGIVDLKNDAFEEIKLLNQNKRECMAKISKTLLQSDCIITISTAKIEARFGFSGSTVSLSKNSLLCPDEKVLDRLLKQSYRQFLNQGQEVNSLNLKRIMSRLRINLALIDGYETLQLQKNDSKMIPTQFAIAGINPGYVDLLASTVLRVNSKRNSYLEELGAKTLDNCFIIGDDWQTLKLS